MTNLLARIARVLTFICAANLVPPALAADPPATAIFPTAGVLFDVPPGWHEQPRDKFKTIGRWISPGSNPRSPDALIMVEGAKTHDADTEANARFSESKFQPVRASTR